MTDMTTTARATRTPNEVAAQCAGARERLDSPQRYERVQAGAVLAALEWVTEGAPGPRAVQAPITGGLVEPTEDTIVRERLRAEDAEALALRKGLDGTHPGTVGLMLSWFHRRPYTEAPY